MSHQSKIKARVKNISALQKACTKMGLNLLQNGDCRTYYSTVKRDYVVKLNGPYDVGFTQQPDGSYEIDADMWDNKVSKEVGPDCGLLLQSYGEAAVIEAGQMRGMSAYTNILPNGSIEVTLSNMTG